MYFLITGLLAAALCLVGAPAAAAPAALTSSPPAIRLLTYSPPAQIRLLLNGVDVTAQARFRISGLAGELHGNGGVRPISPGKAVLQAVVGQRRLDVPVTVEAAAVPPGFLEDIQPLLAARGCSGGACHARQGGQGGFQLSVLSFDPEADYAALLRGSGGRRVNRTDPARSLLLLKATSAIPHGGGRRIEPGDAAYRLFSAWLASGAPYRSGRGMNLQKISVEPARSRLRAGQKIQLRVTAHYEGGFQRDVTSVSRFLSNEESIAGVTPGGLVEPTPAAGEAAVMAQYQGQVAVSSILRPGSGANTRLDSEPRLNRLDELIYRRLGELNIPPSPLASDSVFLRRVYLDLIGALPEPEEAKLFLAESNAARSKLGLKGVGAVRAALIDRLLERPEYADYWASRWSNLLLVDRDPLFPKGAFAYDRWIRTIFRNNVPYDQFARSLIMGAGETYRDGPANFYRAVATPPEQARSISQLFLGTRLDCAQCHHHPSERWSQDDFYGFAAFFARVRRKGGREFEQVVFDASSGEVVHPKTGAASKPRFLGASELQSEPASRRAELAAWVTSPGNPYFARALVNRYWGLLMGTGIVEPVDDFRVTNPPSNEPLLNELASSFTRSGYNLKQLLKLITTSAAYQRSSEAVPGNAADRRAYSRFYRRRLIAEVLLDAVVQVTGAREKFTGHPAGTRAVQIWDNKLRVDFLELFGRPARLSVCECDRPEGGSVTQLLHLMNSPEMQRRIADPSGPAARLATGAPSAGALVDGLYLRALSRLPTPSERNAALAALRPDFRRGSEDILWALLNSAEFLYNH